MRLLAHSRAARATSLERLQSNRGKFAPTLRRAPLIRTNAVIDGPVRGPISRLLGWPSHLAVIICVTLARWLCACLPRDPPAVPPKFALAARCGLLADRTTGEEAEDHTRPWAQNDLRGSFCRSRHRTVDCPNRPIMCRLMDRICPAMTRFRICSIFLLLMHFFGEPLSLAGIERGEQDKLHAKKIGPNQ